ncbi:hypothetical protein H0H81_005717 [Sphagnurus paluster]|uniref:Uncharacterized protein n=1 Tax=Sphagnurus paluster TaxID=117069 RepID=A0A9P7K5H1_9AGAR|nr:hypothetical protein H0H81_005717 [Sphagnurus paluster]
MAHNRFYALDPLSSLTSISSRASVETYESLKGEISRVEQSQIHLQELVDAAENIIKEKFTPDPNSTYTYKKGSETISVRLNAVMSAMLACVEECGGKSGKRYVASAILACSGKGDNGDVVEALAALGTTWLTHLLFVFKLSRSHKTQSNEEPDESATPTRASYFGEGVAHRNSFQKDVMVRDGCACVLTGFQDPSHPALDENVPDFHLEATHMLYRAIAKFDDDPASDSVGCLSVQILNLTGRTLLYIQFKSAATTFEILVNFTRIPVQTLEELKSHLDDASNGMMLQGDARDGFGS